MSLKKFAAEEKINAPKKTRCMTCNLPADLLTEVEAARESSPRISFPLISKWLKTEHGIMITQATIRNHFVAGHNEQS